MKVGDLIRERGHAEIGIIIDIQHGHRDFRGQPEPYCVWCRGMAEWYEAEYIETKCEVISENR